MTHTDFGCSEKTLRKAMKIAEMAGREQGIAVWGMSQAAQRAVLWPMIHGMKVRTYLRSIEPKD